MVTTTEIGNAFRDEVATLLKLTPGLSNVQTEYPIGSQAVDIYYEEETSVGTRRVACECKNRSAPLTKKRISEEIYTKYNPLLSDNLVEHVRIIAPLTINVQARAYVNGCRGFDFVTRQELESRLIDFRSYVHSLQFLYDEGGLSRYYIRPILQDQTDLEDRLLEWLDEPTARPIAILAGYGMGKTSFARRLAYVAAHLHDNDAAARIPILIPLAEISSEQTLSGLLGKLFTAQNTVRNYHFNLFMELNRRGRFLVILDGFDEMKHTMTWEEFKHNLEQLHKLIEEHSKVVLLGRPSALLSESEELYVLRGLNTERDKFRWVDGAPEYMELELQPFSKEQALQFIEIYAAHRAESSAHVRQDAISRAELSRRLAELRRDENVAALIQRPVQAKMVADLAVDPNVEWRSFSRYELYDEFISRIIQRESKKPARRLFTEEQRRRFVENVAWWVWRKRDVANFDASDLPNGFISQFVGKDLEQSDHDGTVRDLVSGSLLERKTGGKYFFPHRSFMEFLVAGHIARSEWTPNDLVDVSKLVNEEVATFLIESRYQEKIATWAVHVDASWDAWSLRFLELVATAMNATGKRGVGDRADEDATPATILLGYFRLVQNNAPPATMLNYLMRSFLNVVEIQTKLMCLVALMLARESAIVDFRSRIGRTVVALVLNELLIEQGRELKNLRIIRGELSVRNHPFTIIARFALRGEERPGAFLVHVNWHELYQEIGKELSVLLEMSELLDTLTFTTESFTLAELGSVASALKLGDQGGLIIRFLRLVQEIQENRR